MSNVQQQWLDANQRYLGAAIALVGDAVERHLGAGASDEAREAARRRLDETAAELEAPPAIETVTTRFRLSPFERSILLLCAGCELDGAMAAALARARGGDGRPTFGIALAALPDAHWSALLPDHPLRAWNLIELAPADSLTSAPMRISERVLHFLTGISHVDERWMPLLTQAPPAWLSESQLRAANQLARSLAGIVEQSKTLPHIELFGPDERAKSGIARVACEALGITLCMAEAAELPGGAAERESLARLWDRDASLDAMALLLDLEEATPEQRRNAVALANRIKSLVFIRARDPQSGYRGDLLRIEVPKPGMSERRELWRRALGDNAGALNGEVDLLASHFDVGAAKIAAAAYQVLGWENGESDTPLGTRLWDSCRIEARPRLDDLARRVIPTATWDDLILPPQQKAMLREIASQASQRATVYEQWGFGARGNRGLGISALFAGPSGTGKTMAGEVLANALRLDLYAVDLSAVVSKYIGETEQNLRRIFDAAEEGGAVLLIDEADALFGKRSEVKDSHDRYANIEVSYLLQRMEAYRGVAILTTNLRTEIDTAFMRRLRFIVNFPFPDVQQRAEIWRRVFPPATPLDSIDAEKLARLNVAGGHIRNIAVNAAFLAAATGQPVRMAHLLSAARSECAKIERPLTDAETAGWI